MLVSAPDGHYRVSLRRHLEAVDDAEMLHHGSLLVQSYALAESAAADRLETDQRRLGGIEDWGDQLLRVNGRVWTDVEGGRAGAAEVAVTRNAFVHGSRTIDAAARKRLLAAGAPTRPIGSFVTLSYDRLHEFRDRLQSLLNLGGFGR